MAQSGKSSAKKSKPSYIYSIIGVTLVLILLGVLGLFMINARNLSRYFKESIELQVFLRETVKDQQAILLKDSLAVLPFVKQIEYVSKDMAAERFKKENPEENFAILGYNPLDASIDITLYERYVHPDSLKMIEDHIKNRVAVRELNYPKTLVTQVLDKAQKIGMVLLVISIVMAIVVLFLIDNTIRLAMYSNRFLIKTMQMVGATRWFIAKPFDMRSIINGAISAVLAIAGLIALMYTAESALPELKGMRDYWMTGLLFLGLIAIGIVISLLSTHRAVMKYLKLKLDDLY
ncbi:cell division protein FtsX [Chitinophaga sp. GCM10012297]|uniref:Cell division protein FtsX n=1 Tax=Chitinophaga chungangae TaxID=2821488 RepID=A0ABS3YCM7_9BACT|nr:permease-like cell division protein FtsX [Chitinophaga chungangae]MBO9152435.1 permease-like cell division protein FtsX [Chitinophaga chungangae]